MIRMQTIAPITSALAIPKVYLKEAGFLPILIDKILINKAQTSESICAASVMMAAELDQIPPTNSMIMKIKQNTATILS